MPNKSKIKQSSRQIRRVTNLSIFTNILLTIIKIVVGLFAGSIALVADGIHSVSDMATDVAVLAGLHFSAKEPDPKHPYGHSWAETFAAGFIAIVLLVVGGAMIYRAALDIAAGNYSRPGYVVLIIAFLSVVSKELIYFITKKVAIELDSPMLYANAWHHRSDALSSVAVVVGVVTFKFGFVYGDQVATLVIGLMIILVAIKVFGDCFGQLTESAVDSKTSEQIEHVISSQSQIRRWHKLRTRTVGREIFLDVHILVDPDLNVTDAHGISDMLENKLHDQIARPVNITVHIEPDMA